MRMLATKYVGKANPMLAKKVRAETEHLQAPLKGLSLASRGTIGDPQSATLLRNFTVEDDRIQVRAGYRKLATRGTAAIWHLIPYYGVPQALLAASNNEVWDASAGTLVKGGFTSNDWQWTAFSNLGDADYTVMVNGADGVWSWNGSLIPDTSAGAVSATFTKSTGVGVDTLVTVASGDIGKFANGRTVLVAGVTASGYSACNGYHVINSVGTPANTFKLTGVDTNAATPATATGTVDPIIGGIRKEVVTAKTSDAFINPNNFNIVIAHQNRLFFADKSNLAVYYLPLQQKSGEVKYLPLNVIFKRGGYIKAMYSWTIEGATNMNNQLVVFTSNGECAIYGGNDPDTDFALAGLYRFDAPMSKHSVVNYGGELHVLIPTGLVPMSTLMKVESESLGQSDRNIVSAFLTDAINYRDSPGWAAMLNPSSGRMFCNIPLGATNRYKQYVRHMPTGKWMEYADIPSRCWGWLDPFVYFGDDQGNVYVMHPVYKSDDGKAINVAVQTAWNGFRTAAEKHFTAVTTYLTTDGSPHPVIDVMVDYDDQSAIFNAPDLTDMVGGANWDTATWDVDYWEQGVRNLAIWQGVAPSGVVGAVRLLARVFNCSFSISGFDVTYEKSRYGP